MWPLFRRILHPLENVSWLITAGTFAYALFSLGKVDWHSGAHLSFLVIALLLAFVSWGLGQLRKRLSAGIVRYQADQTSADALDLMKAVKDECFYMGQSFETSLETFQQSRLAGGMAAVARIRLLLTDPADPGVIQFLSTNYWQDISAAAVKKELGGRLIRPLEGLERVGDVEIRAHHQHIRFWLHRFDGKEIIFGMLPKGEDGTVAPALQLEEVPGQWNLFNHFDDLCKQTKQTWDRSTPKDRREWLDELRN